MSLSGLVFLFLLYRHVPVLCTGMFAVNFLNVWLTELLKIFIIMFN